MVCPACRHQDACILLVCLGCPWVSWRTGDTSYWVLLMLSGSFLGWWASTALGSAFVVPVIIFCLSILSPSVNCLDLLTVPFSLSSCYHFLKHSNLVSRASMDSPSCDSRSCDSGNALLRTTPSFWGDRGWQSCVPQLVNCSRAASECCFSRAASGVRKVFGQGCFQFILFGW